MPDTLSIKQLLDYAMREINALCLDLAPTFQCGTQGFSLRPRSFLAGRKFDKIVEPLTSKMAKPNLWILEMRGFQRPSDDALNACIKIYTTATPSFDFGTRDVVRRQTLRRQVAQAASACSTYSG
ncbi:MAG: hypothetical protein C0510_05355 [Erythrobacter sp.]|nr:hypothetical protein [Erythrobacter sp.]